jgi:hypothetical protein
MKLLISIFFTLLFAVFGGSSYGQDFEVTKPLPAQNYLGITPDKKYGLPNNIGTYSDETGIISSCISLYDKEKPTISDDQHYFGVSFKIKSLLPLTITLIDSRIFNEFKLKTASGEAPYCSGTFESSTMIYQDTIQMGSIPQYIAFKLVDQINYNFELTDSSVITEKADIAFVLRGYNGTTEYNFPARFRSDAKRSLKGLTELSFGAINSYRIFDGGIDPNSPDYYQSLEEIKVIDKALSGWTGYPWETYKEQDAASGAILTNPTDEEIFVLQSLRQWLVANKKGARTGGWQETELGAAHYGTWVDTKVLRYGGSAAGTFINGFRLPKGLNELNFKAIGVIFSSTDKYNTSALSANCKNLGITKSDGQALPGPNWISPQTYHFSIEKKVATGDHPIVCFYSDYSDEVPDISTAESLAGGNAHTTIHEAIHALGQGGHDSDESGDDFPYGVMTVGGAADQYPVWNRVFILGWLPESTITDDPTLVADTYGATDPNAKYLLRLGPLNDFDCISYVLVTFGGFTDNDNTDIRKCHRYQELYNGNWIQYKAAYTEGGSTWRPVGVKFEPLNDLADTKAPEIISTNGNAVEIEQDELDRRFIKVRFDEQIYPGKGYVVIKGADGTRLLSEQTNRLRELSSDKLEVSGYLLKINTGFIINSGQDYSLSFSDGAITDRAGNSVEPRSYVFSDN